MKRTISIWLCILLIFSGITLIVDIPEVQGAFITWPGDHIIDGVTEYYGPGDVVNAGGDVLIINDGVLILDGAILNFTVALKAISVGSTGNGTLNITGGGETRIATVGEYYIYGGNGNLFFDNARILNSVSVSLGGEINARINNTIITNTSSSPGINIVADNVVVTNTTVMNCFRGINIASANNVLLDNVTIENTSRYGIREVNYCNNNTFNNCKINNVEDGITIDGPVNETFINNISIHNFSQYGIWVGSLFLSQNLSLYVNGANVTSTIGSGGIGGYLSSAVMKNIVSRYVSFGLRDKAEYDNLTIYGGGVSASGSAYPITDINISNTKIFNPSPSFNAGGIMIAGNKTLTNVSLSNITIRDAEQRGIWVRFSKNISLLSNIHLDNISKDGILLNMTEGHTLIQNVTVNNSVTSGEAGRYAFYINNANGTGIENGRINISNSGSSGMYMDNCNEMDFDDIIIKNSTSTGLISVICNNISFNHLVTEDASKNFFGNKNCFINNSYFGNSSSTSVLVSANSQLLIENSTIFEPSVTDISVDVNSQVITKNTTFRTYSYTIGSGSSNITVQWYVNLHVLDNLTSNSPVYPVNIWMNDTGGQERWNGLNDNNGYSNWTVMTQKIIGFGAQDYSPYDIAIVNDTYRYDLTNELIDESKWYTIYLVDPPKMQGVMADGVNPLYLGYNEDSFGLNGTAVDNSDNIIAAEYFMDAIGTPGTGTSMQFLDGSGNSPSEVLYSDIDTSNKVTWNFGTSHTFYVHADDGHGWGPYRNVTVYIVDDDLPATENVEANATSGTWQMPFSSNWFNLTAIINDTGHGDSNITNAEYFTSMPTGNFNGTGTSMLNGDGAWDSASEEVYSIIDTTDKVNWPVNSSHEFYVHGCDETGNWSPLVQVTVNVFDDVPPEISNVNADGVNPLVLEYPFSSFNLSAIINDTLGGSQNITAAEYFVDNIGNSTTGISMMPQDGIWNSSVEQVYSIINASAWNFGESHTYYVHGFDGNNWSAFLNVTVTKPGLDYIDIVDNTSIAVPDMAVAIFYEITGYAAGYNDTTGYLGLINVTWAVNNSNSNATINKQNGTECSFHAGYQNGTAIWTASYFNGARWCNDSVEFSIDGKYPSVISTMPSDGSAEVPVNTSIQITFSEAMDMNSVEQAISFANISSYNWQNQKILTIQPAENLSYSTWYFLSINTTATDIMGLQLPSAYVFSFTTLLDTDGDGIPDIDDPDDDNDGVEDENDAFPLDPDETLDYDGDGIGDNADLDDDNDGTPDEIDAFPLDPDEDADTDGDGIGNNADTDDDGDGVLDDDDFDPLDPDVTEDPTIQDGSGPGQYGWIIAVIIFVSVCSIVWLLHIEIKTKDTETTEKSPEEKE